MPAEQGKGECSNSRSPSPRNSEVPAAGDGIAHDVGLMGSAQNHRVHAGVTPASEYSLGDTVKKNISGNRVKADGNPMQAVEQLQRVIFPRPGDPLDVRSLYLIETGSTPSRTHVLSRTNLMVPADAEVSFETYFNGFAASYWRRWTTLTSVVLRIAVTGSGRIDVYRSKTDGSRIAVAGQVFGITGAEIAQGPAAAQTSVTPIDTAEGPIAVVEVEVDLAPFEDSGWIWFDLTSDTDVEIIEAGWFSSVAAPATRPDPRPGHEGETTDNSRSVVIGIPTFNRPDDAINALHALASDPEVDSAIEAVIMVDQGSRHVSDHPGFESAIAPFGERYRRFDQGNFGGSGGYSRVMYEALQTTQSPFILYMDDDIAIEPDSVLRAVEFARFSKKPMLVGGEMLNLQERSHLHSMGEVIDRNSFMWTSAPHVHYDHDFARYPLSDKENSTDLHRRIDVEFNGWWMCLIPRVIAEQAGQPLPLFIKWDDAEYGLRTGKLGYSTVTMPGIAIWHMAWSDKDDAIDWQAYFHLRNRLVVAAMYLDGNPRGMLASSLKATLKHLLCLEYSTVAIQIEAIRDFLRGPDALFELLPSALPKVAQIRSRFSDAVVLPSATELPPASGVPAGLISEPRGRVRKVVRLARGLAHSLKSDDPNASEAPEANFPPIEARWYSLSQIDRATVTTSDGRGVVYRRRNRKKASALISESLRLHRELAQRFDEMRDAYRAAHGELTSRESWKDFFDGHGDQA